jgi:hypothetical protein
MVDGHSSEIRRVHPLDVMGEEARRAPARITVDEEASAHRVTVAVVVAAGPLFGEPSDSPADTPISGPST